jgi:GDP-D-mannose dehydratase
MTNIIFSVEHISRAYRLGQISTGEAHSVREFLDEAFGYLDMDWHEYVKIYPLPAQ